MISGGPINVSRVRNAHSRFLRSLNLMLENEASLAGEAAKTFVETKHPGFQHRTHHLSRSTGYKVVKTRGGLILKIRNTAKYAKFQNNGTRFIKPTWFLRKATEFAATQFQRRSKRLHRLSARFRRAK